MAYRKRFGDRSGGGLSPATRITQEIIARLEAGTKPWIQPWRGVPVSRPLRACGIPYRGMNVFWLWMVADMSGYTSPYWMTYNQAKGLGAQVITPQTWMLRGHRLDETFDGNEADAAPGGVVSRAGLRGGESRLVRIAI